MPILMMRSGAAALKMYWKPIFAVGAFNSALPFCLFAYSTLYLTGGFTGIIKDTSRMLIIDSSIIFIGIKEVRATKYILFKIPQFLEMDHGIF